MLFLTNKHVAQNWTPPINVSNTNGFIIQSDFTIDNNGVIHCVWNYKFNSNFAVIYYSKSTNDGFSWTDPIIISQNDDNFCSEPYIVHNNENSIYVGYDLNNFNPPYGTYTTFVKKDTNGWGVPLSLSLGSNTCLAVDNNDRVYIFWYKGFNSGEFYYKYLEDTVWSDVICPFDNNEASFINEIIVDSANNLHCVGVHRHIGSNLDNPAYYYYNYATDVWDQIIDISSGDSNRDTDIALDSKQNPHICWEEDATYYRYFDGANWSIIDTVSLTDPFSIVIDIDTMDNIHISVTEELTDGMKLTYYSFDEVADWVSHIIDTSTNVIFTPEFELFSNVLYLNYKKSDIPGYGDVFISKKDLITSSEIPIKNETTIKNEVYNYPNPFNAVTSIRFTLKIPEFVILSIIDLNGNLINTLLNNNLNEGVHTIKWDATNISGRKVQCGIYTCILKTNSQSFATKIIYLDNKSY